MQHFRFLHPKLVLFTILGFSVSSTAFAEEKTKSGAKPEAAAPAGESSPDGERVNVEKVKEKYWARGEEGEVGVVQNRLYSKEKKFEFGLLGGIVATDPFLDVKAAGATFGYHFSEFFSAHLLYAKYFVKGSSALTYLNNDIGARANTNEPRYFAGGEGRASLIYGKLSLLGKSIIYYDFHFTAGVGQTGTESGNYITPYLGLGQQVYLSKSTSLMIDYRLMRYNEDIIEKVKPKTLGQVQGNRTNWSNAITIGLSFLFGK